MLAAAMRDPPGLWLAERGVVHTGGQARAERILRRVLSPAAQIEGVDTQLADPSLPLRARRAAFFVLLLPSLGNLSNPFYSVHPRRNDRFVAAHPPLRTLYAEIDLAEPVFTGHLLAMLERADPMRLALIGQALRPIWLQRVGDMLAVLPPRGVLLHLEPPGPLPLPIAELAGVCGAGRHVMPVRLSRCGEAAARLAAYLDRIACETGT